MTLSELSAVVLQRQALASQKCPQLAGEYASLVASIAYEMKAYGPSSTLSGALAGQLQTLEGLCASGQTVESSKPSSPLPLIAIAAVAAYLLFN